MDNVYGRFASFFKNYELKEVDKYIKRVFPNAEFYLDYEHALGTMSRKRTHKIDKF